MPWKGVITVSEQRIAFVHRVLDQATPVAQACGEFRISRKTAYKWLNRFKQDPSQPMEDRSRQPKTSPRQTPQPVVKRILRIRDRYYWGAAKIHTILRNKHLPIPSVRTVNAILQRNGRVGRTQWPEPDIQRFERSQANEPWQLDFKGPVEVQRQRVYPLTILDDHSRYLLRLAPCTDMRFTTTWPAGARKLLEAECPQKA